MRKTILTYGLIGGGILAGLMFIQIPFWKNGTLNLDNGEWVGYTVMVVALTLVFMGVKAYRDHHAGGFITFGQGFKVGPHHANRFSDVLYGLGSYFFIYGRTVHGTDGAIRASGDKSRGRERK